ncbi:BON domain-containing protein [Pleurocapsa sp. PCC 7319]|uniref:BON domain-containing protein n=1 Tax=Pleurocapsa sp. PCC 7319 TaxID=118161 RepID=UPI00034936EB|nr:BON domain-containing protein [Pleurocapsa sp. PCC 7319]
MNKLITLSLGSILLLTAVGCDVARTSGDAPNSVEEGFVVEDKTKVKDTLGDANSEIRQDQLNSDIRAREQRNDLWGEQGERTNSDLESQVRAKLEANIPRAKLTIDADDGKVVIVGTVPDQREYETIEPLAFEILGVKSVEMDVKVIPPNK